MPLLIQDIEYSIDSFSLQVQLELPEGKLTSFLGPSGCGKTTLLNIIAGLLEPASGKIMFREQDLTSLDPRTREIALVFQDYALFPHMNVEKNIRYGMREKGRTADARLQELLSLVRLENYEKRRPDELSGGEKQRVALARALASGPKILLLDEPLSALDAKLRKELRRQIREIQEATGITTVYVTHDQEEALAISDHIVLMQNGRVIQEGDPETIYSRPDRWFSGHFIGNANLIALDEAQPGVYNSPWGPVEVQKKDQHCTYWLHFRPDDCRITDEEDTKNGISGTGVIRYREYTGDGHILEVYSNDQMIKIKTQQAFKIGDTVRWSVAKTALQIIAEPQEVPNLKN
jgi:thiamine transport system ATP-binding protein